MPSEELAKARQAAALAKTAALKAAEENAAAERRLTLLEQREQHIATLQKIEEELKQDKKKPVLILPRLLSDQTDVDPAARDHLDPQSQQIVGVIKKLTTPEKPLVHSTQIKEYILENFSIPFPTYWMAKTGPKEAERWWKNIYDKAIERMDLTLGLIVRRNKTGKKGMYALTEYWKKFTLGVYDDKMDYGGLPFRPLKVADDDKFKLEPYVTDKDGVHAPAWLAK